MSQNTNRDYAEEIIRLFVPKDRQDGLLFKLARPNRRNEVISALTNGIAFSPRCLRQLPKKPTPDQIYSRLLAKGAGSEAYIFSRYEDWHGKFISLYEALRVLVEDTGGTLVYCFTGQMGYLKPVDKRITTSFTERGRRLEICLGANRTFLQGLV